MSANISIPVGLGGMPVFSNMGGKRAIDLFGGAVPMLLTRRNPDHVALPDFLYGNCTCWSTRMHRS